MSVEKKDITVKVYTPNEVEPREFSWGPSTTVAQAAAEVAAAFGIDGDVSLQRGNEVFDPNALVINVFHSGDELEATNIGGGVLVLPTETVRANVEAELEPLTSHVKRHGWAVEWKPDELKIELTGPDPHGEDRPVRLVADVAGYKAQPPAWTFPDRFPKGGNVAPNIGSVFHSKKVICAPFNRLAFKQHDGPHGNWGDTTAWRKVTKHVRATTLSEMFLIIRLHLAHSKGWN